MADAAAAVHELALDDERARREHRAAHRVLGHHHEVVSYAVLFCLGVLPSMAVYRPKVVGIAGVLGAIGAAGGYFSHASQPMLWDAWAQSGAAGMVVFVVTAAFLGLLTLAEPVLASVLALVLFGETPMALALLGIGIVLVAIAVVVAAPRATPGD